MGEATRERTETAPENALLSTGPKTEAGKAVSSQNAMKHGFRSQKVVIAGEDPAEFAAFKAAWVGEVAPVGERELKLAEEIAGLHWKRARAERLEVEFWEKGSAAGPDGEVSATPLADMLCAHGKEFSLLLRYQGQIWRALDKAKQELAELQRARKAAEAAVAALRERVAARQGQGQGQGPAAGAAEVTTNGGLGAESRNGRPVGAGGAGGAGPVGGKAAPASVRRSQFIPGAR